MTGPQVVEEVAELFPQDLLFSLAMKSSPIAYRVLPDWLNDCGTNVPFHSSRLFICQLTPNLYIEDDESLATEEITKYILKSGRHTTRRCQEQSDSEDE